MLSPLDLERLAVRIETLQRTSTHGWHPGDELEFKRVMPDSRAQRRLPDPTQLRDIARRMKIDPQEREALLDELGASNWRVWVQLAMTNEGLVGQNRPGSHRRVMRDLQRGKVTPETMSIMRRLKR